MVVWLAKLTSIDFILPQLISIYLNWSQFISIGIIKWSQLIPIIELHRVFIRYSVSVSVYTPTPTPTPKNRIFFGVSNNKSCCSLPLAKILNGKNCSWLKTSESESVYTPTPTPNAEKKTRCNYMVPIDLNLFFEKFLPIWFVLIVFLIIFFKWYYLRSIEINWCKMRSIEVNFASGATTVVSINLNIGLLLTCQHFKWANC